MSENGFENQTSCWDSFAMLIHAPKSLDKKYYFLRCLFFNSNILSLQFVIHFSSIILTAQLQKITSNDIADTILQNDIYDGFELFARTFLIF